MGFSEYSSSLKVNAEQVTESRSVITPQGPITAYPGQWEVRYPDGNVRILDDEAFQDQWGGEGDSDDSEPSLSDDSERSGIAQTEAPATVSTGSGTDESDTPAATEDAVSDSGSSPASETTVPATESTPTGTGSTGTESGTETGTASPSEPPV